MTNNIKGVLLDVGESIVIGGGYGICKDLHKVMEASNQFMVDPVTSIRVALIPAVEEVRDGEGNITQPYVAEHYPVGSIPEYDYWVLASKNLPEGATFWDLIAQQMTEFCTKSEVNSY